MPYTDDPLKDFENHEREQAKRLERLPKCANCGEPIQDEFYYEINDEPICQECLDRDFRKEVCL